MTRLTFARECKNVSRSTATEPGLRAFTASCILGLLLATCLLSSSNATAQVSNSEIALAQPTADAQSAPQDLPDSPPPQQASDDQNGKQTKRILGIIPNFRAVSANEKLPPQSPKEKFITATQDSFDYSSIVIPAAIAGLAMARNSTPEFHQGAAGYARYFWHAALDQTSENYMVEFIVPSITKQDIRYYTLGEGGFWKRTGYALSRAVVTRSDAGNEVFNTSEVIGAGAAAGISCTYYPTRQRSFSNTASQWGLNVGIDAATFVAKEFWPDINRRIFHNKN